MFARILKGAPFGNHNAKGHGGKKVPWVDPRNKQPQVQVQVQVQQPPIEPPKATKEATRGGHKSVTGHEAIKRMLHEGWEISRVKGSHHFMKKAGFAPIPVPAHTKDLGIGLLKSISKHTQIIF